jgi:hypothetical protein
MRYADHLKRSMDRLTTDAWEKLLAAGSTDRPAPKTVLTTCPCCGTPVVIGLAATLLPGSPACTRANSAAAPPAPAARALTDTQLEMTILTRTDLVGV